MEPLWISVSRPFPARWKEVTTCSMSALITSLYEYWYQRSSGTPYGATTTTSPAGKVSIGQVSWKKNLRPSQQLTIFLMWLPPVPLITKIWRWSEESHGGTGSVLHTDIINLSNRLALPTDNAVDVGRQAVQCGVFPLYEVENGKYKINVTPEPLKPVADYLKGQGRFRHWLKQISTRFRIKSTRIGPGLKI